MHLSDTDITHLAALARLELKPEKRQAFADQLSRVLDYLDHVNAHDASQEAAIRPRAAASPVNFRTDVAKPSPENLIEQAPRREGHSVVSPHVG